METPVEVFRRKLTEENRRHKQELTFIKSELEKAQETCPHPEYKDDTYNHPKFGLIFFGSKCVLCNKDQPKLEESNSAQNNENIRDE